MTTVSSLSHIVGGDGCHEVFDYFQYGEDEDDEMGSSLTVEKMTSNKSIENDDTPTFVRPIIGASCPISYSSNERHPLETWIA